MQVLDEPRLGAPAVALVVESLEPAAKREALAQRRCARQHRLLLDQHDRETIARLDLAVVRVCAVPRSPAAATDLPVPLRPMRPMRSPSLDDEVGAVEQRMEPEGELGVLQGEERHVRAGWLFQTRSNVPLIASTYSAGS